MFNLDCISKLLIIFDIFVSSATLGISLENFISKMPNVLMGYKSSLPYGGVCYLLFENQI